MQARPLHHYLRAVKFGCFTIIFTFVLGSKMPLLSAKLNARIVFVSLEFSISIYSFLIVKLADT